MVNIARFIKEKKQMFRERRLKRVADDSERTASKLSELKRERLALEGRAKLQQIEESERARIRTAKGPNALQRLGSGLARAQNRTRKFQKSRASRPSLFAPSSSGSQGMQMGGGGPQMFGDTSSARPPPKKKKRNDITINIRR